MSMAVPGGAIGVESKWYSPLHAAHANSFGFCLHGLTMLTARLTWSVSLHQFAMGNSGGREAVTDLKQAL